MDLAYVHAGGISRYGPDDLETLLSRTDGFTWIDCPQWDDDT